MGTLGCIHDMMRRDKENRELRQHNRERMKETRRRMTECRHTEPSSYPFRGKAGGNKETDTRERTSRPKPRLQNQTDSGVSHTCPSAVMRTLALKASYTCFSNLTNTKVFSGFQPKRKATTLTYLTFHGQRTAMRFYEIA